MNRCVQLAQRAASEGWDRERARLEISRAEATHLPSYVEIDEARDSIGGIDLPFDVAAAIDLLFEAGFPGIPNDPDHNFGNVHYHFANAWLKRVDQGELVAVDPVKRHCQLSRQFYAQWQPVVHGSRGHPTWADVRQLEGLLHWKLASRRHTIRNLRTAVELFEEARPCYPAEVRYYPILLLESTLLIELSEHEAENANLRSALELIRSARSCFDIGDPNFQHAFAVESEIWKRLIESDLTTREDKRLLEDFVERALREPPADPLAHEQVIGLKHLFVKKHSQWGSLLLDMAREKYAAFSGRDVAQRTLRMIEKILF